MSQDPSRDEVLASFASEENVGPDTLKRYLKGHPTLASELVQLSRELQRSWDDDAALSAQDRASIDVAIRRFTGGSSLRLGLSAAEPKAFRAAADRLGLPQQVLVAVRQRRVEPSSVPAPLMARLAQALYTSTADLLGYLQQPPALGARSAKADGKPAATPAKVAIERLLSDAGVPEHRIRELMG